MNIFIVGYMASGKTTFGEALSRKLKVPFVDLDQYIEKKEGMPVIDIFREKGETGFREIEKDMLRRVAEEYDRAVIACGGGTPCNFDNMEFMNAQGLTIFLETSTPVLISRLQEENASRPLMAGKTNEEVEEQVLSQLCQRLPRYMEAKLKWHGDDLDTETQIEENVEKFVSSYPSVFR